MDGLLLGYIVCTVWDKLSIGLREGNMESDILLVEIGEYIWIGIVLFD